MLRDARPELAVAAVSAGKLNLRWDACVVQQYEEGLDVLPPEVSTYSAAQSRVQTAPRRSTLTQCHRTTRMHANVAFAAAFDAGIPNALCNACLLPLACKDLRSGFRRGYSKRLVQRMRSIASRANLQAPTAGLQRPTAGQQRQGAALGSAQIHSAPARGDHARRQPPTPAFSEL
eukprot:2846531-Pleurochrysis_carterae.AAC.1